MARSKMAKRAAANQASPPAAAATASPEGSSVDDPSCAALFADSRKVAIKLVRVHDHFVCALCQGYLRDPQTIKECLHTFCNGCIRSYFTWDNNKCPTCATALGVRPWNLLIPDPAMQELARKLLPDYTAKEKAEEVAFYSHLGIKRKRTHASPAPAASEPSPVRNKFTLGPSPTQMISFELRPQKNADLPLFLMLKPLKDPKMRTQALLKIMYIRKFVAMKLSLRSADEVVILCRGAPVGGEHTLEFVRRTCWKDDAKMQLEFRLAPAAIEARYPARRAGKAGHPSPKPPSQSKRPRNG